MLSDDGMRAAARQDARAAEVGVGCALTKRLAGESRFERRLTWHAAFCRSLRFDR
jgi:hypothetical protein